MQSRPSTSRRSAAAKSPAEIPSKKEIVSIYPALSPPTLTFDASKRLCDALSLLQCIALHSETRIPFIKANIHLYLYPFLNTTSETRPLEYLRIASLGVICALVKVNDPEVISFLLQTEIIPLCLDAMELGSELSKTAATFIVQKILLDDVGLWHICARSETFLAIETMLANMVVSVAEQPSTRLLGHIIRCYLRLSDNPRACEVLQNSVPEMLKDRNFNERLSNDEATLEALRQLLHNISGDNLGFIPHPSGLDLMLGS